MVFIVSGSVQNSQQSRLLNEQNKQISDSDLDLRKGSEMTSFLFWKLSEHGFSALLSSVVYSGLLCKHPSGGFISGQYPRIPLSQ
jgi:hypothetical protein